HFPHFVQRMKFFPTPFLQIPQGHLPDSSINPEPTSHFNTFVFPMLTFSPIASSPAFHLLIFSNKLFSDSAIKTKSSAYSNSHGNPHLKQLDNASITMINSSGLSTEP